MQKFVRVCRWLLFLTFCALFGNSVQAAPKARFIDDSALMGRLVQRGTALIQAGAAKDSKTLDAQLERKSCRLTLPARLTQPLADADLYENAGASVFIVGGVYKCPRCPNWHASSATAFAVADGVICTSSHVVARNEKDEKQNYEGLFAMNLDGEVFPVQEVLAANRQRDTCLLRIDAKNLKPLPLGEAAPAGSRVRVVSHPSGRFYYFSAGQVARCFMLRGVPWLGITADFGKGSSGAPVFDEAGNVVAQVNNTMSLYYQEHDGKQENLQMVYKNCATAQSILDLIEAEK